MHPRPWHHQSEFGPGPTRILLGSERKTWREKLRCAVGNGLLTLHEAQVGYALSRLLSLDGRLYPAYETIALAAQVSRRTVARAIKKLRGLGLLDWVRRLIREGDEVRQTSNAYELLTPAALPLPEPASLPCADPEKPDLQKQDKVSINGNLFSASVALGPMVKPDRITIRRAIHEFRVLCGVVPNAGSA